jgi:apolipoprotein D and lipocalin family protein
LPATRGPASPASGSDAVPPSPRRGLRDQPVRETPIFTAPPGSRRGGGPAAADSDARVTSTRLRRGRPLLRGAAERAADQARRSARDLSSLSKEIYTAPPGGRGSDAADARVTVSTRLRKPKVHLTAPATALRVDLRRYMGRWYEIARLPYFTQRRCVGNVHADYVLGDDGLVHVTNRCTHADGGIGCAKGIARVTDPGSNARLEISFRMLYGVHVFWDDYWIIAVGDDYEYALVGQPTRRRGWVLARDPRPPEADIERWLADFAGRGFPADDFVRTRQDPQTG